MKSIYKSNTEITVRNGFLLSALKKIICEYKTLLESYKRVKPLKIIEITSLSKTPGETKFLIQVTNKNCVLNLTAAEIMQQNYNLDDFSKYHAELIKYAANGKLLEYLKLSDDVPEYKLVSKIIDRENKQYLFTIETKEGTQFTRTANELSKDTQILSNLTINDIFDIGYTQGSESILKEKLALLLVKKND